MRQPKTHPVFLKVYGRPRTPEPTMAMKMFAKVLDCDERRRGFPRSGVSSRGKGGSTFDDEHASFLSNPIFKLSLSLNLLPLSNLQRRASEIKKTELEFQKKKESGLI